MLILEDYWERNAELRGVPIYQASGLARRALTVFQTYIEMMNADIKAAFDQVCCGCCLCIHCACASFSWQFVLTGRPA